MSAFIFRGPLPPGSPLFYGRQAELRKLARLCQGEVQGYGVVYGGRQTGKTSLLYQLEELLAGKTEPLRIDFQAVAGASAEQVYAHIGQRLAGCLVEEEPAGLATAGALMDFLNRALGQRPDLKLVLLLEEIGALPGGVREELANAVRAMFSSRHDRRWRSLGRLVVILSGGVELHRLAATEVSTLMNICEPVYLGDLGESDALELVSQGLAKAGAAPEAARALARRVYGQAHGHPYLTQRFGALLEEVLEESGQLSENSVDEAAKSMVRQDMFFGRLHRGVEESGLGEALACVLREPPRFWRTNEEIAQLELLGVVREEAGLAAARNPLIARAFRAEPTGLSAKEEEERKGSGAARRRTQASGPIRNRWALLVGVNQYSDRYNYAPLTVCAEDVRAVREQLVQRGFSAERVSVIDDASECAPSAQEIALTLESMARAAGPEDLLLFYYSGHGDEYHGEPYLVTKTGYRIRLPGSGLPVAQVKQILMEAQARAKILIVDACHSGTAYQKGGQPMSAGFLQRVFEEAEGLAVLSSCKQEELSYEWAENKRSVFTHYLLEALDGRADREEKGFVTVNDLNGYVTDGVKVWAAQNRVAQTPVASVTGVGDMIVVDYREGVKP